MADKVIPLDFYEDYTFSAGGDAFSIPKTVVLKRYVKLPDRMYRPNRRNIFLRDNYNCAYCKRQLEPCELSIDHIMPKSRGGKETWDNLVTSCKSCNCLKGDRTPEEAGMILWPK